MRRKCAKSGHPDTHSVLKLVSWSTNVGRYPFKLADKGA